VRAYRNTVTVANLDGNFNQLEAHLKQLNIGIPLSRIERGPIMNNMEYDIEMRVSKSGGMQRKQNNEPSKRFVYVYDDEHKL
jgi:hypothetical protein